MLKSTERSGRKLKKTHINGKTSCVHGMEDLNCSDVNITKVVYILNAILIKILTTYFTEIEKNTFQKLYGISNDF